MNTKNWMVRVYKGETVIDSWKILNRTEENAESEAMADVARQYNGTETTWTMTETGIERQTT